MAKTTQRYHLTMSKEVAQVVKAAAGTLSISAFIREAAYQEATRKLARSPAASSQQREALAA
jgi:hypothetical protein